MDASWDGVVARPPRPVELWMLCPQDHERLVEQMDHAAKTRWGFCRTCHRQFKLHYDVTAEPRGS